MRLVPTSIVLFSCSAAPPPDYSDTETTTLAVTFAIDAAVANKIEGPVTGIFYGRAFGAEEVGPLGPKDNAVELGAIEVEVELTRDGSPTDILSRLDVPAVPITVLGFVDIDDNADPADPDPNKGDPVTLPGENTFEVAAEEENLVEVYFGLLNPF